MTWSLQRLQYHLLASSSVSASDDSTSDTNIPPVPLPRRQQTRPAPTWLRKHLETLSKGETGHLSAFAANANRGRDYTAYSCLCGTSTTNVCSIALISFPSDGVGANSNTRFWVRIGANRPRHAMQISTAFPANERTTRATSRMLPSVAPSSENVGSQAVAPFELLTASHHEGNTHVALTHSHVLDDPPTTLAATRT